MSNFSPVIGITGLNATDNPGPGISVIRSLRLDPSFAGKVVGLSYDALDPGNFSDYTDSIYLIPYPSQGTAALEARLAAVVEQSGIEVCIPTLDSELPGFMALEARLAEWGVATFLPSSRQYEMRSKIRLSELGKSAGISTPKQQVLSNQSDLYKIHEEIPYPLVLKGVFYGAEICHSVDEAVAAWNHTVAKWGLPVIIQEFVAGTEFDILAVGDGKGQLVGAVPMKKMHITEKGKGWSGVVVASDELQEITRRFMEATQWRGPCELEVLRTREGRLALLEVNPRFPAWTYLSAGAGQNLPLAVARLALGESVDPLPPPRPGTMFVRISLDQITHISRFEQIVTRGEYHHEERQ